MENKREELSLKDCPFCGSSASFTEDTSPLSDRIVWLVGCDSEDCPAVPLICGHSRKIDAANAWNTRAASVDRVEIEPLDVILFCPECETQHIDKAEPDVCEKCGHGKGDHFDPDNKLGLNEDGCAECESAGAFEKCQGFVAWLNPPHKKHRCHECNHVWKPAMTETNGVAAMEKGNDQ